MPATGACIDDVLPDGACARRLEYVHPGVTFWWTALDEGVEFGWDVDAPPDDGDELRFQLDVSGVDWLAPAGEGAELVDAEGRMWFLSGAVAWDAKGQPLPASLRVDGEEVWVSVDAADADYPVTVDPLLTTASWSASGEAPDDAFGGSVAGAGDVNGDGYDDVMVGAPYYDGSGVNVGRAYVFYGSASGPSLTAAWTADGEGSYHAFGATAPAGDVNADGYADILVSAYNYGPGTTLSTGKAYLYLGSPSGPSATADWTATGAATSDYLGSSVAGAGDVNGDGYDDIAVGAPFYGGVNTGRAYVYLGSASGPSSAADWTYTGGSYAGAGTGVAGAGDVNGDGYDDLLVGSGYDGIGPPCCTGRADLFYGSASGLSTTPAWTGTGEATSNYYGLSVASAGDVNGDGYGDILVGASNYASVGRVYVYYGSATGPATTASWTSTGVASGDALGVAIARAGDVDADGYDEVILGLQGYDPSSLTDAGAAWVYYGSASGLGSTPWTVEGSATGSHLGASVAGAGDVNGDGLDDVIVGEDQRYYLPSPDPGAAYVFLGSGDADGDGYDVSSDCDDSDASVNPGAAEIWYDGVDQNCDGQSDFDRDGDGYPWIRFGGTDCRDGMAWVNPGATEIVGNRIDENCNGSLRW